MDERRVTQRRRVDENGCIVVDEHTAIPCMIYDRSDSGLRLTMLDTSRVPEAFVMAEDGGEFSVCIVAWRTHEEIGARFAAPSMLIGL